MCALPVPAEHEAVVVELIKPLHDRFVAAAPPGAKHHIADAFTVGNEPWAAVARDVRDELFALMQNIRLVVVYAARRFALARNVFEHSQNIIAQAKAASSGRYRITGAERPSDERIEDNVMSTLLLMLDGFAEQEKRQRVDILFDEIDKPVADRYRDALEVTRSLTRNHHKVAGWDTHEKQRVSGSITMAADAPFRLDSQFVGEIAVVGKSSPLVFAADVVANSLWRHLGTLDDAAWLNDAAAVAGWPLGDLVWGKDAEKNLDTI
jgi:hypothetical protein